MTGRQPDIHETILRQCAASAPEPWYPRPFAESTGVARDGLDAALERLRLRGLVQLTDWVPGHGQGYRLTREGETVLQQARLLAEVRAGRVPSAPERAEGAPREPGRRVTPFERGELIRDAFLNPRRPTVTLGLIFVNVVVFLVGLALAVQRHVPVEKYLGSSAPSILHLTGAVSLVDLTGGQWWRLLTSCFVHIGALHLGVNMYALYNLGQLLERLFGRWRYLLLYLVAGIGGSCVGVAGQPGMLAGASGAICGLLGALAAWTFLNRQFLPPPVLASIQRYLVINSFLIVAISFVPGISWSGHLGGAVFGLVAGALLNFQRFGGRWVSGSALVAVLALPLVGVGGLLYATERSPAVQKRWADAQVAQFLDGVVPPFNERIKDARASYEREAESVVIQHPTRRDLASVAKALAALAEGRRRIEQAQALVAKAGPYTHPPVVNAQKAGEEYAVELGKLFDLRERCLREGEEWKDERELGQQEQRAEKARDVWRAITASS